MNIVKSFFLVLCLITGIYNGYATVRYVKTDGSTVINPDNTFSNAENAVNATSWAAACRDLQAVINVSQAGDTIFAAEGIYTPLYSADGYESREGQATNYPNTSGNNNNAFVLKQGVKIYGGFPDNGSVNTLADRNDWKTNVTTLSGDLAGDDNGFTTNNTNNTDNAYHVIIGANINNTTVLDGFTVSGGNAAVDGFFIVNGINIEANSGGGIINISSSPTLTNIAISGNAAQLSGGGMFNYDGSSPTLTNVTISGNAAQEEGGGMHNIMSSSPTLTNVTISGNVAQHGGGGGIYNYNFSNPTLTNVTISGNVAQGYGGGMFNLYSSSPTLTNVTIGGNIVNGSGGGMSNFESSNPTLTNVTISGNVAQNDKGGGIYSIENSGTTISNSIIWGNSATSNANIYKDNNCTLVYKYSLVQGSGGSGESWNAENFGTDNGNNIDIDPLFKDPISITYNPTTTGDYSLQPCSQAINAGSNALFDGIADAADLAGNYRLFGNNIDMGAYEYQSATRFLTQIKDTVCYTTAYNRYGFDITGLSVGDTVFTDTLAAVNPLYCDSVVTLTLTVRPKVDTVFLSSTICYGGSYTDNGFEILGAVSDSVYYRVNSNVYGCDSVTELTLTVNGTRRYVKVDGNKVDNPNNKFSNAKNARNAFSWDRACSDLQAVINVSQAGDTIFAAAGIYTPLYSADGYESREGQATNYPNTSTNNDRNNAFVLKQGVKIYGGFPEDGSVNTLADRNDWKTNVTTLSGDLGRNDNGFTNNSENAHHVIVGANIDNTTVLDGFTVSGGSGDNLDYAFSFTVNGTSIVSHSGGGIINVSSSPTLTNVTISGNVALTGGGIDNESSSPTLTNVTISGNITQMEGGGMSNLSLSSPTLTNVTISGNVANTSGGGMFNSISSSPTLTNVTISGNVATNGGGMYNYRPSNLTLTNVTISGNVAQNGRGGGIYSREDYETSASFTISNSIIWGNSATTSNNNIYKDNYCTLVYKYSLVQGSGGSGDSWNAENFGTDNGNNIDIDPLFKNSISITSNPTTTGDYSLQPCSQAINAGSNALFDGIAGAADLAGNSRLFGDSIDMGAYEYPSATRFLTQIKDTVCYTTAYNRYGFDITGLSVGDTTFTDTLAAVNPLYCDSIVTLLLTILPEVDTAPLSSTICYGGSYTDNGFEIFGAVSDSVYYRVNPNVHGCDSVTELTLTVRPKVDTVPLSSTICYGESYTYNGFDILNAISDSVYYNVAPNGFGCDSVTELTLTVHLKVDTVFLSSTICYGGSYVDNGFEILDATSNRVYYNVAPNIYGCDSVTKLTLTVRPADTVKLDETICYGETYTKNDFNENLTGIYYRTVPNINGCDSTTVLYLTVRTATDTVKLDETICYGETYTKNDFNENLTGIYYRTVPNINGCDSVTELSLTVRPADTVKIVDTICYGESYVDNGFEILDATSDGVYYNVAPNVYGCDSVTKLTLTVRPALYIEDVVRGVTVHQNAIYPNPVPRSSKVYFTGTLNPDDCHTATLYTLQGLKVWEKHAAEISKGFTAPDVSGAYIMLLHGKNGIVRYKIVVN